MLLTRLCVCVCVCVLLGGRGGIILHCSRHIASHGKLVVGRAVAQAVSRWLTTAAARVRFWAEHVRVCDGQSGTGAGFLLVLRFPLPIIIPGLAH
jgi:hypothetical protein